MSAPTVSLTVLGDPAPMGSRITGTRKDGTRYTRPASKRGTVWKETVAETTRGCAMLPPPYAIDLNFFTAQPKRPRYGWPVIGDIDKLVRGTLDGLTLGGLLQDDKHVVALAAHRNWTTGTPHAEITVRSLAHLFTESRLREARVA